MFGKYGHKVLDAREVRTLIFIVYQRSHFTLLVGLVDEKRWEFYNSMDGDRRSFKHAHKFVRVSSFNSFHIISVAYFTFAVGQLHLDLMFYVDGMVGREL